MSPDSGSALYMLCDLWKLFTISETPFLLRMEVTFSMIAAKIKQDNVKVKMPGS